MLQKPASKIPTYIILSRPYTYQETPEDFYLYSFKCTALSAKAENLIKLRTRFIFFRYPKCVTEYGTLFLWQDKLREIKCSLKDIKELLPRKKAIKRRDSSGTSAQLLCFSLLNQINKKTYKSSVELSFIHKSHRILPQLEKVTGFNSFSLRLCQLVFS